MTMPQRSAAPALGRPGAPGPRPIGRPMAATMARPVPAQQPPAKPVGRPAVPGPRQAGTYQTGAAVASKIRVDTMTG